MRGFDQNPLVDGDQCLHTISCCCVGTQCFPRPTVPPKTDRQTLHRVQGVVLLKYFFTVKKIRKEGRKPTPPPSIFSSQANLLPLHTQRLKNQKFRDPRSARTVLFHYPNCSASRADSKAERLQKRLDDGLYAIRTPHF